MRDKAKSSQNKSSKKKKPMVQVRDLRPKKNAKGGRIASGDIFAKLGDIKGG